MAQENQSVITLSIPEADSVLSYVRSSFNGDVPLAGVPAHITLLYPWMPPSRINETVIAELASVFAGSHEFDFTLKVGWFDQEVLLLVPENPRPFVDLTKAIINRWPEFPYYGGEYEQIEPHVTLAYGDHDNLSKLAVGIASQIPVTARASFVTLCTGEPGHMTDIANFPLGSANN